MAKVLKAVGQRLEESREIVKQLSAYTVEQRVAAAAHNAKHAVLER